MYENISFQNLINAIEYSKGEKISEGLVAELYACYSKELPLCIPDLIDLDLLKRRI